VNCEGESFNKETNSIHAFTVGIPGRLNLRGEPLTSQMIQTQMSRDKATAGAGCGQPRPDSGPALLSFMKRFMPTVVLLPSAINAYISHQWLEGRLHNWSIRHGAKGTFTVESATKYSNTAILRVSGYANATFVIPESFARSHSCRRSASGIRTHSSWLCAASLLQ